MILMPMQNVFFESDDLRITSEIGTSGTAIISFIGIGRGLGGPQRNEFGRSINSQNETYSVFYIIDKKKKMVQFNPDMILDILCPELHNFDHVITIGNSMGGFGALYFSGLIDNCHRAIAFVPQFSVMLDTPETRFDWRLSITEWRVANALENITTLSPAVVVFGADEIHDDWHIHQMRARLSSPHCLFILPNCGHDAAKVMRHHGVLSTFIGKAIDGARDYELRDYLENKFASVQTG
jgi:hypothetical protein